MPSRLSRNRFRGGTRGRREHEGHAESIMASRTDAPRPKWIGRRAVLPPFLLLLGLARTDKMGFTPYGYGVDKPVVVRSTVSYGRGWQMLRSRGEGSTATGACDPPQDPSDCNCSSVTTPPPADSEMPACLATSLCHERQPSQAGAASPVRATFLLVLDANASTQRFYFGKRDVFKAYSAQIPLVTRLLISLRAVRTALPVRILATGVRFPAVERKLTELGATVLPDGAARAARVPDWASPWARGSFAKLAALSVRGFDKVILLDNDFVALRNLDHLSHAPTPAAVFGWKCFPRRELRAALLVLEPSEAARRRADALLATAATAVYDDNGEGSVWRKLWPAWHELPAGYAALRSADFDAASWARVSALHDPNLLRKAGRAGWREAGMKQRVRALDNEASKHSKALEVAVREQQAATQPTKRGGGGKKERRARRGRALASPPVDSPGALAGWPRTRHGHKG